MSQKQQWIWPPETGILDLPADRKLLGSSTLRSIEAVWREAKQKLAGTEQLLVFNERLAREWAIETGVIEDVFHVDRGVTLNLIEQGISAALLEHGTTDKPAGYVVDILRDHVEALDWIFETFVTAKQAVTSGAIKELHSLMTAHQAYVDAEDANGTPVRLPLIRGDWKKQPNDAKRDGVLYRYCPPAYSGESVQVSDAKRSRLRGKAIKSFLVGLVVL
jgi:hypothetical protein